MQTESQEQVDQPQVDAQATAEPITYNKAYFLKEYKKRHKLHINRRLEDALEMGELFALASLKLTHKEWQELVKESGYGDTKAYDDMNLAWNKKTIEDLKIEHGIELSLTVWYSIIKTTKAVRDEWIEKKWLTSDLKVRKAKELVADWHERERKADEEKQRKADEKPGTGATAGVSGKDETKTETSDATIRSNSPEFLEFRNRPENRGLSNAQIAEKMRNEKAANERAAETETEAAERELAEQGLPPLDGYQQASDLIDQLTNSGRAEEKSVPNNKEFSTMVLVDGKIVVQMFVPATMAETWKGEFKTSYVQQLKLALEACIKNNSDEATTDPELQWEAYPWKSEPTE